ERQHSGGVDVELLALFHDRVPYLHGVFPGNPDFVAKVAGVTGAGDVDKDVADFASGHAEIFEVGDVGLGNGFERLAGGRSLQGEGGEFLGDVFDPHVHVQTVLAKPAQAGIGGRPAVLVFFQASDGAVVDHLALLVAPATVNHLPHADLGDVAGDH